MNKSFTWTWCLVGTLLAGCGGGGGDAPVAAVPLAAGDAIPASVAQSEQGMVNWVTQLAAEDGEAKPALDVAKFTPPTAENSEPVPLR